MEKDFEKWNKLKMKICFQKKTPFFYERELWLCRLGINIGFEEDGKGEAFLRPVVIFKKFNNHIFWGIPLTHTSKGSEFYFNLSFSEKERGSAILSQLRLLDAKRLSHRIGILPKGTYELLKEKLRALMP